MNLDRREKHVLSELWTQYCIPTSNLVGRIISKQVGVFYYALEEKIVCRIIDGHTISYGEASLSPKDKNSPPVGRMIAFARAVVDWVNFTSNEDFSLNGKQLESIARGNILYGEERRNGLDFNMGHTGAHQRKDTLRKQFIFSNGRLTNQYKIVEENTMNPQTRKTFALSYKGDVKVTSLGYRHYEYRCKTHSTAVFTNQRDTLRHLKYHKR